MPVDDSDYRPIPKSVPDGTLAYKWCQLEGDRAAMHTSFRRWTPLDYDKDKLNESIDADLEKYPEALEAFPEKIPVPTIKEAEEAEARARMKSIENSLKCFVEELAGGCVKLGAAQMLKWSPSVSEDEVRRAIKSVYGDDSV